MILLIWVIFILLITALLALDLGVFHRRVHIIETKESLLWTSFWIIISLLFNIAIYFMYEYHLLGIGKEIGHELNGHQAALQYFTGYLLEKSLSLDNIFVIAMIFSYFNVKPQYQHRVLFWGIVGAIVMRGIMILAGTALIAKFVFMTYIFGVLLIITSVKMLITRHDNIEPGKNPLVKLAQRFLTVSQDFNGDRFLTHSDNKRMITPLFLVLIVVESTDVIFALDSIPAILAITYDPFIVFTSNIFAILGLRSLYFALAAVMGKFRYIKMSLVFILAYIGVKMLLSHHYYIKTPITLAVIIVMLLIGIIASLYAGHRDTAKLVSPLDTDSKS
jgi:tellurite resistance protein TerC